MVLVVQGQVEQDVLQGFQVYLSEFFCQCGVYVFQCGDWDFGQFGYVICGCFWVCGWVIEYRWIELVSILMVCGCGKLVCQVMVMVWNGIGVLNGCILMMFGVQWWLFIVENGSIEMFSLEVIMWWMVFSDEDFIVVCLFLLFLCMVGQVFSIWLWKQWFLLSRSRFLLLSSLELMLVLVVQGWLVGISIQKGLLNSGLVRMLVFWNGRVMMIVLSLLVCSLLWRIWVKFFSMYSGICGVIWCSWGIRCGNRQGLMVQMVLIFSGVVNWFLLVWVSLWMFWVCLRIFCVWVMMFLFIGVRCMVFLLCLKISIFSLFLSFFMLIERVGWLMW